MNIIAYKLFRVRKDGTLGSLFIGKEEIVPMNKWLKAKEIPTKGFAFRPGFHACHLPNASHLTEKGRAWYKVLLYNVTKYERPEKQGGLWYTAKKMKVLEKVIK